MKKTYCNYQHLCISFSTILFLLGIALLFPSNVFGQNIANAIAVINESIEDDNDPFDPPQDGGVCAGGAVMFTGYKAICQMAVPNQAFFMIGCRSSNNCTGANGQLVDEHQILVDLNGANVPSALVSQGLIQNMPCGEFPGDHACASFVEARLHGEEIRIAELALNALDQADIDQGDCANHYNMVFAVMEDLIQNSPAFLPVRNLTLQQADMFSESLQAISNFANSPQGYGIGDLQGFLQNQPAGNGEFIVFDPGDEINEDDNKQCFINYTAAIAEITQPDEYLM